MQIFAIVSQGQYSPADQDDRRSSGAIAEYPATYFQSDKGLMLETSAFQIFPSVN